MDVRSKQELERLQAYVDDELSVVERSNVEQALREDRAARATLAELVAIREDLDALGAAVPQRAMSAPNRWSARYLVAGIAAAAVVAILWSGRAREKSEENATGPSNEFFSVRCLPRDGGRGPIFSDLGVNLEIEPKGDHRVRVVPWSADQDEGELARSLATPGTLRSFRSLWR